jgi:hypothetical protein
MTSEDDADRAAEAAIDTPGDKVRDPLAAEPPKPTDKAPGSFGDAPKKRGRPFGSKNKPRDGAVTDPEGKSKAWLQKKLAALLVSPSFAFEMVGEQWPAEHIGKAGPDLAKEIANYAERNPAFKMRLVMFLEGGETASLAFAVIMYVAPLAMYFGVAPAPPRLKAMLQIPDRGEARFNAAPDPGFGPPSPEALAAEAREKGFDDVGDYMNAVQAAISNVRGDIPGNIAP